MSNTPSELLAAGQYRAWSEAVTTEAHPVRLGGVATFIIIDALPAPLWAELPWTLIKDVHLRTLEPDDIRACARFHTGRCHVTTDVLDPSIWSLFGDTMELTFTLDRLDDPPPLPLHRLTVKAVGPAALAVLCSEPARVKEFRSPGLSWKAQDGVVMVCHDIETARLGPLLSANVHSLELVGQVGPAHIEALTSASGTATSLILPWSLQGLTDTQFDALRISLDRLPCQWLGFAPNHRLTKDDVRALALERERAAAERERQRLALKSRVEVKKSPSWDELVRIVDSWSARLSRSKPSWPETLRKALAKRWEPPAAPALCLLPLGRDQKQLRNLASDLKRLHYAWLYENGHGLPRLTAARVKKWFPGEFNEENSPPYSEDRVWDHVQNDRYIDLKGGLTALAEALVDVSELPDDHARAELYLALETDL